MPWSDWQDGYDAAGTSTAVPPADNVHGFGVGFAATINGVKDVVKENASHGGTDVDPFPTIDLTTFDSEVLGDVRGTDDPDPGGSPFLASVTGLKFGQRGVADFDPPDAMLYEWTAELRLGQFAYGWEVTDPPADLTATPPAGLPFGVTSTSGPGGTPGWQWETDAAEIAWDDIPVTVVPYATREGVFNQYGSPDMTDFVFALPLEYWAVPTAAVTYGVWNDVSAGVQIAATELDFSLADGFVGGDPLPSAVPLSVTLTLSGIGDVRTVSIVAQLAAVHTGGDELFRDVLEIPQTDVINAINAYGYDVQPQTFAGGGFDDLLTGFVPVTLTAHYPRWRYWTEDEPLRTVGDHFISVGGADVKSLIPGVGWVKVRRGT